MPWSMRWGRKREHTWYVGDSPSVGICQAQLCRANYIPCGSTQPASFAIPPAGDRSGHSIETDISRITVVVGAHGRVRFRALVSHFVALVALAATPAPPSPALPYDKLLNDLEHDYTMWSLHEKSDRCDRCRRTRCR